MKNSVLLFLFFCCTNAVMATTCTSIADGGNWTDPNTWDCGRIPASDDVIIITAGQTVHVDCNCGIYTNFRLEVYGTLWFDNGQKINLDATGIIQVHLGGIITGDNGGSKIVIDGETKWRGNEPDIIGPSYLNASNPGPVTGNLPIELLSFNANLEGSNVVINWATASELNNDFFSIERSTDALEWKTISTVQGAGTSVNTIYYNYTDKDAEFGTSYYRLKQTDFDGTTSLSEIQVIENNNKTNIKIYPNPTSDQLTIEGQGIGNTDFAITNSLGQSLPAIYSHSVNKIYVDLNGIDEGIYFVNIHYNGELESFKIIVQ